jgi:predicted O-methyltransferase YrrM
MPWLVYSATSYISPLVVGKRVFEFGSGMSTLWFADRAREVISVESSLGWYNRVVNCTRGMNHVRVVYADSRSNYINAISEVGGKFDVVLVDGLYRNDCLSLVRRYLNTAGLVVVDNTDVELNLAEDVRDVFSDSEIRVFCGWAPGILHPNETTVIQKIPV